MEFQERGDKYDDILDVLVNGSQDDLENLSEINADFPEGVDTLVQRRWIINAIDVGSLLSVTWMIDKNVSLNFEDEEGTTVFSACIHRQKKDKYTILHALISAGADYNIRGKSTWTPLHLAAVIPDFKAIRILLDAGADPTIRTIIDDYETPSEQADHMEYPASAKYIREYGN